MSFKAWLHRSFIDLGEPVTADYLPPFGVELAWRALEGARTLPRFHILMYPSFRLRLAAEAQPERIALRRAGEIAPEHRTARWRTPGLAAA
jgi:hypothetical protein